MILLYLEVGMPVFLLQEHTKGRLSLGVSDIDIVIFGKQGFDE